MVVDDDEQRACTAAAAGDGGGDDHLSGLPDDVLLDILEKVVVMDGDAHAAARTCILSRRWRHLPWHNVTNVSLDVDDFIPDKEHAWRPVLQAHHRRATENLAAALASFLAAPLSKRVIDKLRLKLVLTTDDDHVHRVGALVGDAFDTGRVKAGAVELEILAESACTFVDDDDKKRLMLGYGRRFSRLRRACPGAFRSLARLTVHNLWFDGGDTAAITHLILHGCPALEYLYMFYCGFVTFSVMTIDAPPESRLATLVFDQCFAAGVELVNAPKLKEFYYGWLNGEPVVSYGGTPSLNGITLENFYDNEEQQDDDGVVYDFNWKLSNIIPENPGQLERLCIKSFGTKIWVQPEEPLKLTSQLGGLKKLELDDISHTCNSLMDNVSAGSGATPGNFYHRYGQPRVQSCRMAQEMALAAGAAAVAGIQAPPPRRALHPPRLRRRRRPAVREDGDGDGRQSGAPRHGRRVVGVRRLRRRRSQVAGSGQVEAQVSTSPAVRWCARRQAQTWHQHLCPYRNTSLGIIQYYFLF